MNAFMKFFPEPVSESEGRERNVGEKSTWAVGVCFIARDHGSLPEEQNQLRWGSFSKPPPLLSICLWTLYSVLWSNYFKQSYYNPGKWVKFSHFKDKNTETQPGLRNWLKVMWLISGSARISPHTSGPYILPTTSLPAAPAPPFILALGWIDREDER